MDVGYIRVSTAEQNSSRQLDGITLGKVFSEAVSGKTRRRPVLAECLEFVRQGDTLHIHSMDRLARNLDDLRQIVRQLNSKGVKVQFHKEGLTFTGEDSPGAHLLLSVMGAFAEFERALLLERQAEGIALAKAAGKYTGRKPALSDTQAAELCRRALAGENKAALAREFGISRASVYAYLKGQPEASQC